MTNGYDANTWYKTTGLKIFYHYYWAVFNGKCLGAEYDSAGNFMLVDVWDDEVAHTKSQLNRKEANVNFDEWDGDKQGMMEELIKVFWKWCQ
jgi:hypothetical protein